MIIFRQTHFTKLKLKYYGQHCRVLLETIAFLVPGLASEAIKYPDLVCVGRQVMTGVSQSGVPHGTLMGNNDDDLVELGIPSFRTKP